MHVMGITKCPLCDSEGPPDSPEIVEHVFQHVHSFSLRSLPWPMDPTFSLERPVGRFDMNHAFKTIRGDNGHEYVFRIDDWSESVAPTFDLEKGEKTVMDDQGEELVFGIVGWPEDRTLAGDHSLQLCDIDRNTPKQSEEEIAATAMYETDYFAQNDYFMDESGDGRFPSQTSHSSQTQFASSMVCNKGRRDGRAPFVACRVSKAMMHITNIWTVHIPQMWMRSPPPTSSCGNVRCWTKLIGMECKSSK
jgi:hypothetical protein